MSTIIMVHGTFATGPQTGDKWWQETSAFENDLRKFVKSDGGELKFARIIWSGDNTESARRAAAKDIFATIQSCQRNNEPCCIIGHSHGGSAITSALMLAAHRKEELPCLKSWITVASPFIKLRKSRWLFARVSQWGQAAYVVLVTFAVLACLASWASFSGGQVIIAFITLAVLPFVLFYASVYLVNARKFVHYSRKGIARFDEYFGARWLGLWHKDDEAICGLRTLGATDLPIIGREFAVPVFSAVSIFLLPACLLWFLSQAQLMAAVLEYHIQHLGSKKLERIAAGGKLIGDGADWGVNFNLIITTLWEVAKSFMPAGLEAFAVLFLLVGVPCALFLMSLLFVFVATFVARLVSGGLSGSLNSLVMQQLRQTGLGGNVRGETAVGAEPFPAWLQERFPPLPDELGREISDTSSKAASQVIEKFRSLIGALAFADAGLDGSALAKLLSWNELIHTTYFTVPRFRVLIAYAIAQTSGFCASDALQRHPDYACAEQWYVAITKSTAR
jgi:hypothetical protein